MFAKFRAALALDRASVLIWLSSLLLSLVIRCHWHWLMNCEPLFGLQLLLSHCLATPLVMLWSSLNILFYDLASQQFGCWTLFTSSAYALVSWLTGYFIQRQFKFWPTKQPKLRVYLGLTVIATLLYDLSTASMGPLVWGQSWSVMLWGQIPFTLYHLLSNLISAGSVYACLAVLQVQLNRPASKLLKFFSHLTHHFN